MLYYVIGETDCYGFGYLLMLNYFFFVYYFVAENNAPAEDRTAELYVECALYIDGAPFGLPTRTRLSYFVQFIVQFILHRTLDVVE